MTVHILKLVCLILEVYQVKHDKKNEHLGKERLLELCIYFSPGSVSMVN